MAWEKTRPILLVTGSSGLIGSRIVREFAPDFAVVGMDVKSPGAMEGAAFVACDLTSDEDTARALGVVRRDHGNRIASVIHLAAYYDFSGEPSPLYRTLTVEGTRRLLRELRKFQVEQFVFASTLLVMEPSEEEPITEESPREDEPWDYPRSKQEAEEAIREEHGDVPAVILRIAGVYDDAGHSVPVAQHIARIHQKKIESYLFPGDPSHGQPFVHLEDLVACVARVIRKRSALDPLEVFLIAEPDPMTFDELQERLGEEIHGSEWPTIRIPKVVAKAGAWVRGKLAGEGEEAFVKPWMIDLADVHYPVAIDRARTRLGWQPRHRLRDTLPEIVRRLHEDPRSWYESNGLPVPDEFAEAPTGPNR